MTSSCAEAAATSRPPFLHLCLPALGVLAAACGHDRMLPATTAHPVPGAPGFAAVEQDGVRLVASGDDWTARPPDLPERLTPIRVRIVNHSGHALQILYERFVLAGGHGHVYRPLPLVPLLPDQSRQAPGPVRPYFAFSSFFVRPAYRDVYPSLPPWPTRLHGDDRLHARQYKRWDPDLPTNEMQRLALPEGVLADGGQMSGFLFFENATDRESKVRFKAELKDDQGKDTVASISIPFRIE